MGSFTSIGTATPMPLLSIPPDSQGYAIQFDDGVLEIQLDGGAPRQRADQVNTVSTIPVRWSVDPAGYNYLMAFYRTVGKPPLGPQPFQMAIPVDTSDATEIHQCMFVAKSFKLASQSGLQYVVTASIYVWSVAIDPNDDGQTLAVYGS
jgi:hypothetical protein